MCCVYYVDWMEVDVNVSLQTIVQKGRGLIWKNYWSYQTFCRFTGRLILDILIKNCEVKKEAHAKMNESQ